MLIGVDGLNSGVRLFVVGDNDPAAVPRSTGARDMITRRSGAGGKELFGEDAFFQLSLFNLHGKELLNVILAFHGTGTELPDGQRRVVVSFVPMS